MEKLTVQNKLLTDRAEESAAGGRAKCADLTAKLAKVGRCRLTVSKPVLKAMLKSLETIISSL